MGGPVHLLQLFGEDQGRPSRGTLTRGSKGKVQKKHKKLTNVSFGLTYIHTP